jgi:hypothetical protein
VILEEQTMPAPDPSPQTGDPTPPPVTPPQDGATAPADSTPVRGVPVVPAPEGAQPPAAAPPVAPVPPVTPPAAAAPRAAAPPVAYPAPGQPTGYPQPIQPGQPVQPIAPGQAAQPGQPAQPAQPAAGYPAPVQVSAQPAAAPASPAPASGAPGAPAPGAPVYPAPVDPAAAYPAPGQTIPGQPVPAVPYGAAPGQPAWAGAAPAPAAPKIPVPFPALLASAARRAGAGYLAALVLAFVQTVLLIGFTDEMPLGAVVSLPVLLVSMSLLGSASVSYAESSMFVDSSFDASLHVVPLTLLLALLAGVVVVATLERKANRLPAAEGTLPRDRWITAALTGGVLMVGASILAAVLRVSVPDQEIRLGAFGIALVLGAFLVGGIASVLGDLLGRRGSVHPHRIGLRVRPTGEIRAALASVTTLLGLPAVVLLVVGLVWIAVESADVLLGVPALVLNVLVWAVAVVMGGGISAAGGSSYGDSSAEVQTLFGSGVPGWAIALLLLLALVATLASGVVLAVRRPGAGWGRAWITPLVFAVVAGLLTLLSGVVVSGGISLGAVGGSAGGWIGIAPWWFLSLAVWAVGVEAVARYVVPFLIRLLPAARQQALYRRAAAPAAAGVPGAPTIDGSDPAQPGMPVAAPLSPTARRWVLIGGIGVAALVVLGVGGAIAVSQINQRVFGPEQVAQEYLDALEAGDASTAIEIGSVDTLEVDEALLTDEIYAAATDRPTDGQVVDVERSGDSAVLTVEYQQRGATVTETLFARRTGSTAVLFDEWQLRGNSIGTITLSNSAAGDALTVNDVDVVLADGWTLAALPGTYTLAGAESRWLDSGETSVTVRGTGWADAETPAATPSAELETEVDRLVSDYLATCIASTETEPADCPNESWVYYDLAGVTWTLDTAPVVSLNLDYSWEEGEYVLDTVTPGSATLTGTYAEETWSHAIGEPYSETVEIEMYGTIVVDGDDVRYEYSRY